MKTLPLTLALLTPLLAAIPAARAQDDDAGNVIDDTPHVTIIGSASTEVAPDLATITLGATNEKPTAKAAAEQTAQTAQAIVDAAKAQGVKPTDIATQSVTLTQTFDEIRDVNGRDVGRRPRGYEASNTIAIRSRDLTKVGALAQSLIEKGANRFDGIAFSIEHPEPILERLTAEAVANARRQAQTAAQAAGAKLGRVLLIERPDGSRPGQPPVFGVSRMAAAPKAMPVEAGVEGVGTEVEVTWAIDTN